MNCKHCQAELEDGVTVCPVCGTDNAEQPAPAEPELAQATGEPAEEPAEETIEEAAEEVTEEAAEESPEEATEEPAEESADAAEEPAGEGTEAPEEPPVKKKKAWKIALLTLGCVVLLGVLATAVFYGVNGGFRIRKNDVMFKDTYSVSAEKAQAQINTVVATMDDGATLTNGQLQIYYWTQVYDFIDYYTSQFGVSPIDYSKPLDELMVSEEDGRTWQQYFLDIALETWQRHQALCILADRAGFQLDAEMQSVLDALPEQIDALAKEQGYADAAEILEKEYGPGCTIEDYVAYWTRYNKGYLYFETEYDKLNPTDAEIEAYFTEHEADFTASGITKDSAPLVDVRHILIMPKGGTTDENGSTTYSDEEWETCLASAQEILDDWLSGEATEESFGELATAHSEDTGSAADGGLIANLTQGSTVEEFDAWCYEEGRKTGDYGLVRTEYGYHIIYFVDSRPMWRTYALNNLLSDLSTDLVNEAVEQHPMNVNYRKIVLGEAALASAS